MPSEKENELHAEIVDHVVGFIDVLSQKHHLGRWGEEKDIEAQKPESVDAIEQSLLVVHQMREMISDYIQRYNVPSQVAKEIQKNNPDGYKAYLLAVTPDVKMFSFSDTAVVSCRAQMEHKPIAIMRSILGILIGFSVVQLHFLSRKIALRGSLDIGLGCDNLLSELYGPCLSKAHELESKVACYPRIVVGIDLVNFLIRTQSENQDSHLSPANQRMADFAMQILTNDDDGKFIVDFAGPAVCDLLQKTDTGGVSNWKEVYTSAQDFASSSLERFRHNEKLMCRYSRLVNYLKMNEEHWK